MLKMLGGSLNTMEFRDILPQAGTVSKMAYLEPHMTGILGQLCPPPLPPPLGGFSLLYASSCAYVI